MPSLPPPDATMERLRHWSWLLDQAFRIPGTNIRFGWDVLVGLIPGIGDLSSPAFGVLLLLQAHRMRVPRVVQARMVINAGMDALLGVVPGLGNIADIFWKANTWNMALLERHARPGVPHQRGDTLFVWGFVAAIAVAACVPLLLALWLLAWLVGG